MNTERSNFCETIAKGEETYSFSMEHVLPDYLPSVRKVLLCLTRIKQYEAIPSGDTIRFGGELSATILCLSEDGKLFSTVLQQNFACSTEAEGVASGDTVFSIPQIKSSECRALSPKKLSLKSEVQIRYKVFSERYSLPSFKNGGADEISTTERKIETILCGKADTLEGIEMRISRDLALDPSRPAVADILVCSIRPCMDEIRCYDGRMTGKGRAFVDLLCRAESEEGETIHVKESIEFSLQTEDPKITANALCDCHLCVKDIEAMIGSDAYGEKKTIELDFTINADLLILSEKECDFVHDAYSTQCECEITKKSFGCFSPLTAFTTSVSGECDCGGAPLGEGDHPVFAAIHPTVLAPREENGKMVFDLTLDTFCLLSRSGIDPYETIEHKGTAKIATSLPMAEANSFSDTHCQAVVTDLRSENGMVKARYELLFTVLLTKPLETQAVCEIALHREKKIPDSGRMLLVYPEKGESDWEIAKRHHIPLAEAEASKRDEGQCYYCLRPGKCLFHKVI